MKEFDHIRWHYELIESLGSYRELNHFVSDEAAVTAHLYGEGRPKTMLENGEVGPVDDSRVERWRDILRRSVDTAISSYRRQLAVVTVSVTEAAIVEAFEVLFYFDPDSMKALEKDFQDHSFRAVVTLQELKNATALDDLRQMLVDRAVAIATQGKSIIKVLNRIEKLLGGQFEASVRANYLELVELRNEIVHDNKKCILSSEAVEEHFSTGISFISELGRLTAQRGLPINDPLQVCET